MSIIDEKSAQKASEVARAPRRNSLGDAPEVVMSEVPSDGPIPVEAELGAEDDVPPAYSELHDQFSLHQTGFDAGAAVTGRS